MDKSIIERRLFWKKKKMNHCAVITNLDAVVPNTELVSIKKFFPVKILLFDKEKGERQSNTINTFVESISTKGMTIDILNYNLHLPLGRKFFVELHLPNSKDKIIIKTLPVNFIQSEIPKLDVLFEELTKTQIRLLQNFIDTFIKENRPIFRVKDIYGKQTPDFQEKEKKIKSSVRKKIKGFLDLVHAYEEEIDSLRKEIDSNPSYWYRFQAEVDNIFASVFNLCLNFELNNRDNEKKVKRMKHFFIKQFRPYFRLGRYNRWVIDRPFGYCGDYFIIEEIYKNSAETVGVERCLDNYFLNTGASIATRNRKEDFKSFIKQLLTEKQNLKLRIMDLGSGSCRIVKELLDEGGELRNLYVDFVDYDVRAIAYSKGILNSYKYYSNLRFFCKNVVRMALEKRIENKFLDKYDMIFSAGLFDYLSDEIAIKLLMNIRKLLKPDGFLMIVNYRDKFSNPSRHYMEWGGDWDLIYRTEEEFLKLFEAAGFRSKDLKIFREKLNIMQYCKAINQC